MRVDASLSLGNHGVFFIRSSEEGEGEHSHPSMGEHYGRDHPYITSAFLDLFWPTHTICTACPREIVPRGGHPLG